MIRSIGDRLSPSLTGAKYDPLTTDLANDNDFDDEFLIVEKSDLIFPISGRSSDSESSDLSSFQNVNRYLYPEIDRVEELHPEQVRWFYKDPGDKKWSPFIGYDSLRIECQYRESKHREGKKDFTKEEDGGKTDRIDVRGGIYEVDVDEKLCYPIYWINKGSKINYPIN